MLKGDSENNPSKHHGYISGMSFLLVFSSAFIFISHVLNQMEAHYQEKMVTVKALKHLAAFDIRADIYAYMASSTKTYDLFNEEIYINNARICLETMGEIYIFGEENQ